MYITKHCTITSGHSIYTNKKPNKLYNNLPTDEKEKSTMCARGFGMMHVYLDSVEVHNMH